MFDLPKYGDGICLARLATLLEALAIDRPRLQRNSVVVTGSNGKGSTAAFVAHIGRAYGLRTGLFTSPHLYRFNERFRIDGVQIGDDVLAQLVLRVATAIADLASAGLPDRFGAFEAQFALACLYFQEMDCAFAVFEAGIGGRYDPVRLVGATTSCVTSVDYEHVDLLGHSLALICSDKSDACAAGGTIVYGENCRPLRRHLAEYHRNRDIVAIHVGDDIAIDNASSSASTQRFDLRYGEHDFAALEMSLPGDVQFNNAAVAVVVFLCWLQTSRNGGNLATIDAAIRAGVRDTRWPGRLEVIQHDPLTVIDVGHTPDGAARALGSLGNIHGRDDWILVLGISGDKSIDAITAILAPSFGTIVCTSAYHKGADAPSIATAARQKNPDATIHIAGTIEDAVRLSQQLARDHRGKVYVAGGLFVAIEYATTLRGEQATALRFF